MRITGEGEEFSILVLKSFSVDWIGSKRIGIPCLNDEDHRGEEEEFPIPKACPVVRCNRGLDSIKLFVV